MKWRKYNLGATVPESAGLYFSWGNIDGHPAGAGYDFSQATYNTTPGAAITEDLTLDNDAARANLGNPWRMPTTAEFQELVENCTTLWTTLNGVNGLLFTSNVNGKTLFFPAAGRLNGTALGGRDKNGYYWASTFNSVERGYNFTFDRYNQYPDNTYVRYDGCSIRPVLDENPNRSIVPPTPEDNPKEEETPTMEEPKDKDER